MKDILKQRNCNTGQQKDFFPITTLDKVIDINTEESLDTLLQKYNHIYLPFKDNSKALTRQQVPDKLRRRGLWITYISCKGKTTTEWYNSDDFSNKAWGDNANWVKYADTETIKEMIKDSVSWYKA